MQIIQVLQTIDWLSQVGNRFIESLDVATGRAGPKTSPGDPVLQALYEHARMSESFRQNPAAIEVLEAFGLSEAFLHESLIFPTLGSHKGEKPTEDQPHRVKGTGK